MKRHSGVMLLVAGLLIASTSLASAAPRKSGNSGGGSSSVWVDTSTVKSVDGFLHYGNQMKLGFATSYAATDGSGPWLKLECFQSGVLVFSDVRAGFPGGYGYDVPFQLGPSMRWTGGEASCNGILGHQGSRSFVTDATAGFTAKA